MKLKKFLSKVADTHGFPSQLEATRTMAQMTNEDFSELWIDICDTINVSDQLERLEEGIKELRAQSKGQA